MNTISAAYDLYANIPISLKYNLALSLPFIIDANDGVNQGSGLGNLFIGIQTRPKPENSVFTSLTAGAYLPTISEKQPEVSFLGTYAYFQEPQKTLNNIITLYLHYNYLIDSEPGHGWKYGFEAGPQVFIPIKASAGSGELFVHYGLMSAYQFSWITVSGEILGLAGITETYSSFGERFDHSVAFAANIKLEQIRPSLFYQFITDDQTGKVIDGIIGAKVAVIFD